MIETGIIGAGAAGLMAAYAAAGDDTKVTVIERNNEPLKKLCLTGNGRCNFSNADLSGKFFNFGENHPFSKILEEYDSNWLENLFKENGMLSINKDGLKYPRSEKAVTVKDTLLKMVKEKNVEILTSEKVTAIEKGTTTEKVTSIEKVTTTEKVTAIEKEKATEKGEKFKVIFEDGKEKEFDRIIITTGGKAYPATGSDGAGFRLARALGHKVTFTYPHLTRLFTEEKDVLTLSGVRFKVKVSGSVNGNKTESESGEIQFTDKGLSGICIFNLSRFLSKPLEDGAECMIIIDFLPEYGEKELSDYLKTQLEKRTYKETLEGMLGGDIASLIQKRVYKHTDKNDISKITEESVRQIKGLEVTISGHDSFSNAQVTGGGVDIAEIGENMESKICKGLFFAGEVMDVDGKCGGYNLHWAFASGFVAGVSASK